MQERLPACYACNGVLYYNYNFRVSKSVDSGSVYIARIHVHSQEIIRFRIEICKAKSVVFSIQSSLYITHLA